VFDFDGVLLDTNGVKRRNIMKAVQQYCPEEAAKEFTDYFMERSGIPREGKVKAYFPLPQAEAILADYGRRNASTLVEARVTPGAEQLIQSCGGRGASCYVISGGTEKETFDVLAAKGLAKYFREVRGGPLTKEENWRKMSVTGHSVYIGDSQADYEFTRAAGISFIFLYGFTAFREWESFFENKSDLLVARSLRNLACGQ